MLPYPLPRHVLKVYFYEWCERERQRERRLLSRIRTRIRPVAKGAYYDYPVIPIIVGIRVVDSSLLCCHANFAGVCVATVGLCV